MSKQDEVRLVVPANPEFLRLARVTAAGLAGRLGFTFDQVEDLRLAIDELCFGLTGSRGRSGSVEVHFVVSEDGLEVHGRGRFEDQRPVSMSELSEVILDALVDEHELVDEPDGARFRLVKRYRPLEDSGGREGGR